MDPPCTAILEGSSRQNGSAAKPSCAITQRRELRDHVDLWPFRCPRASQAPIAGRSNVRAPWRLTLLLPGDRAPARDETRCRVPQARNRGPPARLVRTCCPTVWKTISSGRSTRWPRSKRAPARTRAMRWGAFTAAAPNQARPAGHPRTARTPPPPPSSTPTAKAILTTPCPQAQAHPIACSCAPSSSPEPRPRCRCRPGTGSARPENPAAGPAPPVRVRRGWVAAAYGTAISLILRVPFNTAMPASRGYRRHARRGHAAHLTRKDLRLWNSPASTCLEADSSMPA